MKNYIFLSYGMAAIRELPSKQSNILSRCEPQKYYAIAETKTVDGVLWLHHKDGGWSMERDGQILFKAVSPYKMYEVIKGKTDLSTEAYYTRDNAVATVPAGTLLPAIWRGKANTKVLYGGKILYIRSSMTKKV